MTLDPHHIAYDWTSAFKVALSDVDPIAVADLFFPDGWLRDLLVFTWDIRALAGREKIASYLVRTLAAANVAEVSLNDSIDWAPRTISIPLLHNATGVEVALTFECEHGHGRAHGRLVCDVDGVWRALALMVELLDLAGHEELPTLSLRDDMTGIPGRDMQKEFADWTAEVEKNPYVLIGKALPFDVRVWAQRR